MHLGERLSLMVPLQDGSAELRETVEVRHVRDAGHGEQRWRAGGLFRNLAPAERERVIRFIVAELRIRNGSERCTTRGLANLTRANLANRPHFPAEPIVVL